MRVYLAGSYPSRSWIERLYVTHDVREPTDTEVNE